MKKLFGVALLASLAIGGFALAQQIPAPLVTFQVPIVQAIGPNDVIQDIVGGIPTVGNQYVTAPQLGTYGQTLAGGNQENMIVAGDASNNLFSRGTSVVIATPAAVAYTANQWVGWGGTNTPVTVAKATDAPSNFVNSYSVVKASGAGVVQVCYGQEIEKAIAIRLQGQIAEFDVHMKALAGFSAASSNVAVYILTGTGADEGTVNGAFSINAGGGGSSGWTGAAVLGGTTGYLIPISTAWGRYTVAAPIPTTATEVMVAVCDTPVGTGTATDGFELAGAQLVPNPALATPAGSAGAVLALNDARAKAFARLGVAYDVERQQRYLYAINEGTVTAGSAMLGGGNANATTTAKFTVQFPVTMFKAPTYTNALTATTFKMECGSVTAAVLATPFSATTGANTASTGSITFTTTGLTAGNACNLISAAGSGNALWSAEM